MDVTQYSSSNKRSYGIGTVYVGLTEAFCGKNKFGRCLSISRVFPLLLIVKPWTILVYLGSDSSTAVVGSTALMSRVAVCSMKL